MKPTELRIGNIVHCYDEDRIVSGLNNPFNDSNWDVELKDKERDLFTTSEIEDLIPIQLTEEWLFRLGWIFNDDTDCYEKYPNGDMRMFMKYKDVNQSYEVFNYVTKSLTRKNVKYIHQLQNLYFALTQEELTWKGTQMNS